MEPKNQIEQKNILEAPVPNPWRTAINDTPGNTSEKLKELSTLQGLSYDKVWRVYNGDTPDLRSSDAIKVILKLNEWRSGKMALIIPQDFFLSIRVHKSEQF